MNIDLTRRGPQRLMERFQEGGDLFERVKYDSFYNPFLESIIPEVGKRLATGYQIFLNEFGHDPNPIITVSGFEASFPYQIVTGQCSRGYDKNGEEIEKVEFFSVPCFNGIQLRHNFGGQVTKRGANYSLSSLDSLIFTGFEEVFHANERRKQRKDYESTKNEPTKEEMLAFFKSFEEGMGLKDNRQRYSFNRERTERKNTENREENEVTHEFKKAATKYGIPFKDLSEKEIEIGSTPIFSTIEKFKEDGQIGSWITGGNVGSKDSLLFGAILDLALRTNNVAYVKPNYRIDESRKSIIRYDHKTDILTITQGAIDLWVYAKKERHFNLSASFDLPHHLVDKGEKNNCDFILYAKICTELFKHSQYRVWGPQGAYNNIPKDMLKWKLDKELRYCIYQSQDVWDNVISHKTSPWIR